MGIPHYFKQVTQQFDGLLSYENQTTCERLFLDFNCAIHKCSNDVKKYHANETTAAVMFEDELIDKCIRFIREIVTLIKPTRIVYVSIDGVVPMAKIAQQRKRRYFSDWKKEQIRKVLIRHRDERALCKLDQEWNTNQITPGTSFMESLVSQLTRFSECFSKETGLQIIVDAEAGEGEHKICHFIYANGSSEGDVIYGMDADMILLGMLSKNVDSTTLLREDMKNSTVYTYMNLKNLKDQIYHQFSRYIGDESSEPSFLIKCYVFLTFFLGNDFLPNLTYIHLREDGLDILLRAYSYCYHFFQREQHILTEEIRINGQFFNYFIEQLEHDENTRMLALSNKYYSNKLHNNRPFTPSRIADDADDRIQTEAARIEMYPHMCKFPTNLIEPDKPAWRIQYYYHLFEKTTSSDIANNACTQYVLGLIWMIDYYFKRKTNWDWFYPYNYSPTILDLHNYLQVPEHLIANETLILQDTTRIHEDEQLIMVIPPASIKVCYKDKSYLQKYSTDVSSEFLHLFPTNFEIVTYCKSFLHECGGIGLNMKSRVSLATDALAH